MTQYIDKSALVAEIERWIELLTNEKSQEGASQIDKLSLGGRIAKLQEVKTFLDTLELKEVQEEPVNRTPADIESAMQEVEEKSRAFTESHQGENTDTILAQMRGEEPVSEDLEEASIIHSEIVRNTSFIDEDFIAGAKWQKEKMIKDAVKTEVCERITQNGLLPSVTVLVNEFKPGDKVKLIIIKDE